MEKVENAKKMILQFKAEANGISGKSNHNKQ
jgi:hypothetical protein